MKNHWYERGDTITFDYMYARPLFLKDTESDSSNYDRFSEWGYGRDSSPWFVYSTNKYPQNMLCAIVRVLHKEFTKEFGTAFGYLNIHGGERRCMFREKDEDWRPPLDATIGKKYIKRNKDGWIVVTNAYQFKMDIISFKRRMRKNVFPNYHYFYWGGGFIEKKIGFYCSVLRRLDMFLIASDRERAK